MNINTRFTRLLKPLSPLQKAELTTLLIKEGCREPITIWKGRGIVLDGHHRYAICLERSLPFVTEELEFLDENHAAVWIVNKHKNRRIVSREQDLYRVGMMYLAGGVTQKVLGVAEGFGYHKVGYAIALVYDCRRLDLPFCDLGLEAPPEALAKLSAILDTKGNSAYVRRLQSRCHDRKGDVKPRRLGELSRRTGGNKRPRLPIEVLSAAKRRYRAAGWPRAARALNTPNPPWTRDLLHKYLLSDPRRVVFKDETKTVCLERLFPNITYLARQFMESSGCEDPVIWEKVNETPTLQQHDVAKDLVGGGDGVTKIDPEYKWVASRPFPVPPRDGWQEICGTDEEGTRIYQFLTHIETFANWCVREQVKFASAKAGSGGRVGFFRNMALTYHEAMRDPKRWYETIHHLANIGREIDGETRYYNLLPKQPPAG